MKTLGRIFRHSRTRACAGAQHTCRLHQACGPARNQALSVVTSVATVHKAGEAPSAAPLPSPRS
jgi:hypothetical protein